MEIGYKTLNLFTTSAMLDIGLRLLVSTPHVYTPTERHAFVSSVFFPPWRVHGYRQYAEFGTGWKPIKC
ncbi:hypothetical protein LAZ67_3002809 [Cordylochernes scorpioides]|uniref:Uncharacterized protein n=1 Tax=Cordylochernes scorpioides TaxID=51811 RepID=A0ABY6KCR0_9ARAC|nr:hypothetical protein LAZ67_3002809 [Cordylochernes scorpioides]